MDFYLYRSLPHLLPQSLPSKQVLQKQKKPSAGRVGALVSLDIPGGFASEWSLNMTEQFQLFFQRDDIYHFTRAVMVVRVQYSTMYISVLYTSIFVKQ